MADRKRWVIIAFGVAVVLVFVGIGAIIAVTAWVQQNLDVQPRTAVEADREFDAVRERFPGRKPLLELVDGRPAFTAEHTTAPAAAGPRLQTLHVLAWDGKDERLAKIGLPFWFLRLKSDPIRFSAYASGFDDEGVTLRPEDIERYGPGIILDTTIPEGGRLLLWAE
jgi:hypothetical protein